MFHVFTASIEELSKKGTNFLFSAHLHQLSDMAELKQIETLKFFHLKVKYDREKNLLIYDRKLELGIGETIYGLEVCKSVDIKKSVLEKAHKIRRKLTNNLDLLNKNKSKYNSEVFFR